MQRANTPDPFWCWTLGRLPAQPVRYLERDATSLLDLPAIYLVGIFLVALDIRIIQTSIGNQSNTAKRTRQHQNTLACARNPIRPKLKIAIT